MTTPHNETGPAHQNGTAPAGSPSTPAGPDPPHRPGA